MFPSINPADLSLLGPVVTAAGLAGEGGRRWRLGRKTRAAQFKQARPLYLEVVGNLVWGRIALGTHPPLLVISSSEWRRPGTPALLAELLKDPRQVTQVAAAYAMLDVYERLFRQPWTELLPLRLGGQDVVAIGQVVERFGEAERVLRPALYDVKGQRLMEKALAEVLARTPAAPAAKVSLPARLSNACNSIPIGPQLAVLLALGGWRVAALVGREGGQHRWRWRGQ